MYDSVSERSLPCRSSPMPIVDAYSMSEKLVKQSNHYICHTCTELIA